LTLKLITWLDRKKNKILKNYYFFEIVIARNKYIFDELNIDLFSSKHIFVITNNTMKRNIFIVIPAYLDAWFPKALTQKNRSKV
jgi:hypothetical protein